MRKIFATLLVVLFLLSACNSTELQESEGSLDGDSVGVESIDLLESADENTSVAEGGSSIAMQESSDVEEKPQTKGEELTATLTLEEKVGQLFLAAYPDVNQESYINDYKLGGFIMFGREFKNNTPEGVRTTIENLQKQARIPLLFAVDEEGGSVCRVSAYTQYREKRFYSPRYLYSHGGIDAIAESEKEKCALLSSLGINVNMAPVCDITTDKDAFMYNRSLGQDAETTAEFVEAVIDITDGYKIGNVLKHFPGYSNNKDTHTGIAYDKRSLEELESVDIIPFKAGADAGCGAILVSHTVIECLDGDFPASLSPKVNEYIRNTLGYDGVVLTDDLSMGAITEKYGDGEAAVLAVLAGNDLICLTNLKAAYTAVLEAVKDERISEERIDEACARVLDWKYKLGLLD